MSVVFLDSGVGGLAYLCEFLRNQEQAEQAKTGKKQWHDLHYIADTQGFP